MELQIFQNSGFQIRGGPINNEPYFVAKDICEALGYSNTSKSISDHTDEDEQCPHTGWIAHTNSYSEWIAYLNDKGNKVFGNDWYECAPYFGVKTAKRAYLWKYGLQCAVEYLKENGEKK